MKTAIRIALVTAAALWSLAAAATIENVENAYESDTQHVSLPSGPGGTVVIRECSTCKPVRLRVNRETRYFVGAANAPVTLDALRAAVAAKGKAERLLTVFYSLESGLVTRIVLSAA
jgi:hypothetical protein